MSLIYDIFVIIACLGGLWFGAGWLVEGAVSISRQLRVPELVIGLTIVSIGTSAPEFAVTILSAFKGFSNISVGNVVGSNIFNLGFILGGVAMIRPIQTSGTIVHRDGTVLIVSTFFLLLIFMDLQLSFWEGVFLLCFLVGYLISLFYSRLPVRGNAPAEVFSWSQPFKLVTGFAAILLSSHWLVDSAASLARTFGISEWVIGVTIVAMGTSMPELVTSLAAAVKGHHGISAGNLVGSDIFNLLGVLGVAGTLHPLTVSPEAYGSLLLLSAMVILVVIMMRTGWRISKAEGGLLVCIAVMRWILDFLH